MSEVSSVKTFVDALKSIIVFASKDATIPVLNHIMVEAYGSELTVAATDRYRLGTFRMKYDGEPFSLLVGKDSVSLMLAAFKPFTTARMAELPVEFAPADDHVTVSCMGQTLRVNREHGEFPKWRHLVPNSEPTLPSGIGCFNPDYLASFAKVARSHKSEPMRMTFHGDQRICVVTIGEHFTGAIMQVRF